MPEQRKQQDDRKRNSEQPEQCTSTEAHCILHIWTGSITRARCAGSGFLRRIRWPESEPTRHSRLPRRAFQRGAIPFAGIGGGFIRALQKLEQRAFGIA